MYVFRVGELPVKNGAIDFGFMESFVAELSAYLKVSGYDNYKLSAEELAALRKFGNLPDENWGTYKVGDLFERVETKKLPYKAKELPSEPAHRPSDRWAVLRLFR